jgi:hypothetical protein
MLDLTMLDLVLPDLIRRPDSLELRVLPEAIAIGCKTAGDGVL